MGGRLLLPFIILKTLFKTFRIDFRQKTDGWLKQQTNHQTFQTIQTIKRINI